MHSSEEPEESAVYSHVKTESTEGTANRLWTKHEYIIKVLLGSVLPIFLIETQHRSQQLSNPTHTVLRVSGLFGYFYVCYIYVVLT